jgi:membrane protease YdiL (CAAX protease family)
MTFLEFAARGKNAWWRYILATMLAMVIAAVLGTAIVVVLKLSGRFPADLSVQILHPTRPVTFFATVGTIFGVLLAGFIGATRLVQGKRLGDIVGTWNWSLFLLAGALWFAVQGAAALIGFLVHPHDFAITASSATGRLAIWAFTGLAIQTFAEEYVFRGYVTQALLLASRRPAVAALFSGLLFGALHIPNGTPQAIWATCFGVVAALIAIRTGGLAFTYGLHLANNLFAGVIVVSAGDVFKGIPGVITQSTPQIMGWDVGVGVAAMLGALMLAYRLSPRPSSARR